MDRSSVSTRTGTTTGAATGAHPAVDSESFAMRTASVIQDEHRIPAKVNTIAVTILVLVFGIPAHLLQLPERQLRLPVPVPVRLVGFRARHTQRERWP